MSVKFLDTAPKGKQQVRMNLRRVSNQLRERPGVWAELRSYSGKRKQGGYVYAHNCKTARNRTLSPRMGFEVKAIADGHGNVVVYGRFVGENGEFGGESE